MKIKHADRIRGEVTVPGDKSISHRSIMLGALAKGNTEIHNFRRGRLSLYDLLLLKNGDLHRR